MEMAHRITESLVAEFTARKGVTLLDAPIMAAFFSLGKCEPSQQRVICEELSWSTQYHKWRTQCQGPYIRIDELPKFKINPRIKTNLCYWEKSTIAVADTVLST